MRNQVTRLDPLDSWRAVSLSGAEANIDIRGQHVSNSLDWCLYNFRDRRGTPMRVVALADKSEVRQVYEQCATGTAIQPCDWLEGERPRRPPKPKRSPVKVGGWVSAKPEDDDYWAGIVISCEWAQQEASYPRNLPPFWSWGWWVEVRFSDGRTRQGFWNRSWVRSFTEVPEERLAGFEPSWLALEAELVAERVGQ
ncbi:hypothetical protein ACH4YO_40720 [Streptomyces noursei]|uniref:hypothetical protein n=1 Tax=Streptomyces noursei TaxID=1971 RepID=UPI00081C4054|nr:hypothetical protein SNOUR_00010 [Streptomyces noursei ATCC 11455]ANZ22010.1 hypothetical protein SNOUR_43940 [Streptomyces noursei ATCC 11455]MCZ0991846.1 hypothetical protein [Streptomyces noursei]